MIELLTAVVGMMTPPTLVYVGPRPEDPRFEQAFDSAIGACGVRLDTVQRRYATLREIPATPEHRAAQEAEVADIARGAGFLGPEAEHQVSYELIRAFLQTRTFIRLAMAAKPAQRECVTQWLRAQGFAPVEKDQQLPVSLRD